MPLMQFVYGGLAAFAGAASIGLGFYFSMHARLIASVPLVKTAMMPAGPVEIRGTASSAKEVIAPFSGKVCVYAAYEIYETTKGVDDKGQEVLKSKVIRQCFPRTQFYIEDDTGVALIDPQGARFGTGRYEYIQRLGDENMLNVGEYMQEYRDLMDWEKDETTVVNSEALCLRPILPGSKVSIALQLQTQKSVNTFVEYRIEEDEACYVMGTAAKHPTAPNNLVVKAGDGKVPLTISEHSEKVKVRQALQWTKASFIVGGLLILAGAAYMIAYNWLI